MVFGFPNLDKPEKRMEHGLNRFDGSSRIFALSIFNYKYINPCKSVRSVKSVQENNFLDTNKPITKLPILLITQSPILPDLVNVICCLTRVSYPGLIDVQHKPTIRYNMQTIEATTRVYGSCVLT